VVADDGTSTRRGSDGEALEAMARTVGEGDCGHDRGPRLLVREGQSAAVERRFLAQPKHGSRAVCADL